MMTNRELRRQLHTNAVAIRAGWTLHVGFDAIYINGGSEVLRLTLEEAEGLVKALNEAMAIRAAAIAA